MLKAPNCACREIVVTQGTSPWVVDQSSLGTATITSVVGAASSMVVLAAKTGRRQVFFTNDSAFTVYIAFAPTASLTSYTFAIAPKNTHEISPPCYRGTISAFWDEPEGKLLITEVAI